MIIIRIANRPFAIAFGRRPTRMDGGLNPGVVALETGARGIVTVHRFGGVRVRNDYAGTQFGYTVANQYPT